MTTYMYVVWCCMLHLFQKKNVTLQLGLAAARTASNQPLRSRCSSAAQPQLQLAPGNQQLSLGFLDFPTYWKTII